MEGLDFTELKSTYSTIGRNSAVLPETMFTILVYGYMEGIYSSRALEKACKRDINFKWILQGQQPPGHNSIARFRSKRLKGCIENLFNQFIKKLGELKEIKKNLIIYLLMEQKSKHQLIDIPCMEKEYKLKMKLICKIKSKKYS